MREKWQASQAMSKDQNFPKTWYLVKMLRLTLTRFELFSTKTKFIFQLPDCYLGHSMFGDGICWEMIGKTSPATKKVYYAVPANTNTRFQACGLQLYLTIQ